MEDLFNDPRPGPSRINIPDSDSSTRSIRPTRNERKRKRNSYNQDLLQKLVSEVAELRKQVQTPYEHNNCCSDIDLDVSGELFNEQSDSEKVRDFTINVGTSLKEGATSKTSESDLKTLKRLQHFNTPEWTEVRFADAQKQYLSTPGYVQLECNDEIAMFDTASDLAYAEKSYAALTLAVVKQQESFQEGFCDFLSWVRSPENLTHEKICEKVNDIFTKGKYYTISNDILQMTCGRRADLIEQRRSKILASVRDPLLKTVFRKIPPSCNNLFDADQLTSALDKVGGVRKAFWQKASGNKPAAQAKNLPNMPQPPAQGCTNYYQTPAQGVRNRPHTCCHGQKPNSSQEHMQSNFQSYRHTFPANRGSFRGRRANYRHSAQNTRKREPSPSYRDSQNKKRKY